ncbi:MAG: hypothetical protein HY815_14810 [Candidatus Riflebacteria bacterium]|nr:hypothetical protein [Candidatus Riflebacteria bacterium]
MKVRSRTRTWVGRLGLAVASLVLSLALAEAAVRLLDLGTDIMPVFNRSLTLSSNPVLGYELVPGSEDGKTVINPDGMRDRAYTLSKPPFLMGGRSLRSCRPPSPLPRGTRS